MVDDARLEQWLNVSIGTEVFNVWIAYEDEPIGIITAEIVEEFEPTVFIGFCNSKPKATSLLLEKVEEWAKSKDIHKLLFHTQRNPLPFVKKYGFDIRKVEMTKEI